VIQISSPQNSRIKSLLLLKEKSRERNKTGNFLIEGLREVELALQGNYKINEVFICPQLAAANTLQIIQQLNNIEQFEITEAVYNKVAHRATTEGILAVAKAKNHSLDQLKFTTDSPLVLIAEAPEKPGNIGALLRTADAAGIDAVLIANPKTDIYNPNIIRSSVGCVFTTQIGTATSSELIDFLQKKSFKIYSAALQNAKNYLDVNYTGACALVVGTEAHGLSVAWRENATAIVAIPMKGQIDSMNVSVAAGILLFEALRQRSL
jgi:TrmH family RNA methyltransferase